MSRLGDTLSTVVGAVRGHQARASGRQKEAFDVRVKWQYYSEGELVWVRSKARKRGVCPKLQRRYRGPYRVIERITDVLYRLLLVEGGTEVILHYHKLKPFLSPLPETSNQEGTRRQRAAPPCPGGSGSAGWVRWRASGETGRSGERETHRPAHPGPGSASATSQAVTEGERQTGEPTGHLCGLGTMRCFDSGTSHI